MSTNIDDVIKILDALPLPQAPGSEAVCKDCSAWDTSSEFDCMGNKMTVPNIGYCPNKERMTRPTERCDRFLPNDKLRHGAKTTDHEH